MKRQRAKNAGRYELEHRSGCPVATMLDLAGDRWTLVIVRDMMNGKSRFSEFLNSPERITTNILTNRLAEMERNGLIGKKLYQQRPPRHDYHLTGMGEGLLEVLQAIGRWGNRHVPGTWTTPEEFLNRKPKAN